MDPTDVDVAMAKEIAEAVVNQCWGKLASEGLLVGDMARLSRRALEILVELSVQTTIQLEKDALKGVKNAH